MLIVNKPRAGSSIGYREIHDAKPDGYTIGWASATIVTNKLQGLLPYDHNDFTVLATYANYSPVILASSKTQRQFKTIQEVFAYAKTHPGELSMATAGVGGTWWIAAMALLEGTGLKFNIIPQPGADAYILAQVAGGHTDLGILGLHVAKPQIEAGNVRFLAYYGPERAPGFQNIPTLREVGFDLSWESPHIILGSLKMEAHVREKLVKTIEIMAKDPEFQNYLIERFGAPLYLPPEKVNPYLDQQRNIFRSIMEKVKILKEK